MLCSKGKGGLGGPSWWPSWGSVPSLRVTARSSSLEVDVLSQFPWKQEEVGKEMGSNAPCLQAELLSEQGCGGSGCLHPNLVVVGLGKGMSISWSLCVLSPAPKCNQSPEGLYSSLSLSARNTLRAEWILLRKM